MLFKPAESYDVACMKQEVQDAKVVRARYSRRPPCLAASNAANNSEAGNDVSNFCVNTDLLVRREMRPVRVEVEVWYLSSEAQLFVFWTPEQHSTSAPNFRLRREGGS